MSTLISIAIIIILSLISRAWKNSNRQQPQSTTSDTDLEEELRRMAERMLGNREEPQTQPVVKPQVETYKSLRDEHSENRSSPYDTFDDDEGDEKYEKYNRLPNTPVVDYSERDIQRVEQQYEKYKTPVYTTHTINYDQKTLESLKKGKELHTVMDKEADLHSHGNPLEKHGLMDDFDPRKAVIYAEIFRRPEY